MDSVHMRYSCEFVHGPVPFKVVECSEGVVAYPRVIVHDISSNQMHLDIVPILVQHQKMVQSHHYLQRTQVERCKERTVRVINLCIQSLPYPKL